MLIDTHCHLDFLPEKEIEKAESLGVKGFVIPGVKGYSYIANKLSEKYENVFYSVGVHPLFLNEISPKALDTVYEVGSENENCVAIGEIGLDFFPKNIDKKAQMDFFVNQLEIASRIKKPVIIHWRKGYKEFLEIIENFKDLTYVMHMFSGTLDIAKALLKRLDSVYFSFGAPATRTNAKKALEVLNYIPLELIMVETDSPDLPPEGFKKPNVPSNLPYIAERLAELKKVDKQAFFDKTFENSQKVFKCFCRD